MHEMSLAQAVIDLTVTELQKHPGATLSALEVKAGTLAGVEFETFRAAMAVVLPAAGFPDTRFSLVVIPGRAQCLACGAEFPAEGRFPSCPECGSAQCLVTAGTEFMLSSLSLAEPEPEAH